MSTTLGRWARNYAACTRCRRTDRPHKARGLCTACVQQARRDDDRAARAVWEMPAKYPPQPPCRGCGTTIRPPHSGGLCTDCVRAAGRLHHDPWEAA